LFDKLSFTDNIGNRGNIRSHFQQTNSSSLERDTSSLTSSFLEPPENLGLANIINNSVFRIFSNINREKIKVLLPEVEFSVTNFGQKGIDLVILSETGKWMLLEIKSLKKTYLEQESLFEDYELTFNKKETKRLIKRLKEGPSDEMKRFIEDSIKFYKQMKKKEELYKQGKL